MGSPLFLLTLATASRAAPPLKALHPGRGSLRSVECSMRWPASLWLGHALHPSWTPHAHRVDEDRRFGPQLRT